MRAGPGQKYKADNFDSQVVPMVQVCFCAVHPPIFPFTPYPFFYPRNSIFWDSSVQYNLLVASTSLRRTNSHLPAHGRVCGHSMRCVSSAPFLPTSTPTSFIFSLLFCFGYLFRLCHCELHAPRTPCRNPESEPQPCRALHPDAFPYGFRRGLRQLRGPGSSCSIDVLCTWAACAPIGAQSISFCLLHCMAFIGPNIFCCPSIFTSFSARDWTSLSESFYFTLDSLTCAMHKCRCVRRRGPSSFQFGLDTIRWRWRYAIRRRWGDDTSRSGGTFDGRARTGWLVERRGEEREAGAGPRHCSSTFSWRRGPAASESESARSDFFVYTLLVLPLPLLVAAAQLTRMQQRCAARAR
jgi:hypothetical protein